MDYTKFRLKKMTWYLKPGSILDIGCSRPNPYIKNAVGVDILPNIKHKNYKQVLNYDINKGLPFKENQFNNILAGAVIEHLESPFNFVKECNRVLTPGGRLIITTPNIYSPYSLYIRWLKGKYKHDHIIEMHYHTLQYLINNFMYVVTVKGMYYIIPFVRKLVETKSLKLSNVILAVGEKKYN